MWWAVWIGSFWQKLKYFSTRMDQRGNHMNMNFEHFQIEYYKQIGKSRWKNGVIYLVSILPSWVMVLELSKTCFFCNFVLTSSKKSKSIKAIYIQRSERSRYELSEIGVVYYATTYCFRGMNVWSRRILEEFLLIQHLFWYFNC